MAATDLFTKSDPTPLTRRSHPYMRIHVVYFCGDDQAVHHSGTIAATIGATEQPGLPPQGDTTHGAFGGDIRRTGKFLSWRTTRARLS
jgi:hypothetical protein